MRWNIRLQRMWLNHVAHAPTGALQEVTSSNHGSHLHKTSSRVCKELSIPPLYSTSYSLDQIIFRLLLHWYTFMKKSSSNRPSQNIDIQRSIRLRKMVPLLPFFSSSKLFTNYSAIEPSQPPTPFRRSTNRSRRKRLLPKCRQSSLEPKSVSSLIWHRHASSTISWSSCLPWPSSVLLPSAFILENPQRFEDTSQLKVKKTVLIEIYSVILKLMWKSIDWNCVQKESWFQRKISTVLDGRFGGM